MWQIRCDMRSSRRWSARLSNSARKLPTTPPAHVQALECFALRWIGPAGLPQRTYSVRHPVLGETLIFIVPVGQDGTAGRYEAVFSVPIVQA